MRNRGKERAKPERVVDWRDLGALLSTAVLGLFTLARETLKPLGIGLDFFPWLLQKRREALVEFLRAQGQEFLQERPADPGQAPITYENGALMMRFAAARVGDGQVLRDSRALARLMTLAEIKREFQPAVVTEADILATIRADILPRDCLCLFFLVGGAVDVRWSGRGWYVSAAPVEYPSWWYAGHRVFSHARLPAQAGKF